MRQQHRVGLLLTLSVFLPFAGCAGKMKTTSFLHPEFDFAYVERVAVVPGSAFGPSGEGHVRACYASSYAQIERALERIGRFVQRHE